MICIHGAQIYDPSNHQNGVQRDVWIDGALIVPAPEEDRPHQTIDASGMIIAPAGIEIHTHIAGAQLNAARSLFIDRPELIQLLLPASVEAARRYLQLGYTTLMDAAMPPLFAWQTHTDLERMSCVSRGTYTLMGDHALLLSAAAGGHMDEIKDVIAWLLEISGGYTVKMVNPGAASFWKRGLPAPTLDDPLIDDKLTQRQFIQRVVQAANEMNLPHAVHLHAGRLGQPGNWTSFCDTIRALDGQRAHLCHIQFYCYGDDGHGGLTSEAGRVADLLSQYPLLTADVGQVLFGSALAVSADIAAIGYLHHQIGGNRISRHMEAEGGGSVLPLAYLEKDAAAAIQWAAGLELLLNFPDPNRLFLTCDHPNGGPFTAYPAILNWLMNRDARREVLAKIHPAAREKTGLGSIQREFSLAEVIAMTSSGPAHTLGLHDRGSLSPDKRADIRCYHRISEAQQLFASPAWVMCAGEIVMQKGQINAEKAGETLCVRPDWDIDRRQFLEQQLGDLLSFDVSSYAMQPWLADKKFEVIPCTSTTS